MTTAVARFAGLLELVSFVAHHAFFSGDVPTLEAMSLVSKTFYAAATPYVYREVRIGQPETMLVFWPLMKNRKILRMKRGLNANINHVKEVVLYHNLGLPGLSGEEQHELLHQLLSQMPRLEHFEHIGRLLTPDLFRTLGRSCPRLTSLALSMGADGRNFYNLYIRRRPLAPWTRIMHPKLELGCLSGLRELTLACIPIDDYDWWLPQLVQLLKNSPRLTKLALGFYPVRPGDEEDDAAMHAHYYALDRLCDLYGRTGASPLRLSSLHLLGGTYPFSVNSLKKLADLTHLHDVYISILGAIESPDTVALIAFAPPHAPNLRFFAVDLYIEAVHQHLCTTSESDPSFVRNLGIFAQRMYIEEPPLYTTSLLQPSPDHPSLPLQLKMLNLELSQNDGTGRKDELQCSLEAEQALEDLVSTNPDSLEGLDVSMPYRSIFDPDGFYDPNRPEADMEPSVRLLEPVLRRLPNLTQLSVRSVPCDEATAERLALAGSCLRYIGLASQYKLDHFWRVWRRDDGGIRLEQIQHRDAACVDLWRYSHLS
ncbi:hypothetical protein N657DRAFT_669872 [Parathielavia appendiculata]|uniref:F-box domain-containing protein n=1 Tax=Parathielavia appendiculata TaxID=2587402 RepID=A0AAN6U5S4_9PEZI|nr:hypothetical protein N657DRAFT_669872 [Parathielavia appendiculata]